MPLRHLFQMIVSSMRVFLSWWFRHLAGLFPGFGMLSAAKRADAVILDIGVEVVTLSIRVQGSVATIAQAAADEAGLKELAHALGGIKSIPRLLFLRLPAVQVLKKHLSLPAAARRDLQNLLGFQIDRETPFAREEIYWNYRLLHQDMTRGQIHVELFLILRRSIDSLLEIAQRAGLAPSAIEIDAGKAGVTLVSLKSGISATQARSRWPLIPIPAAACMSVLLAMAAPFAYQQWAIAALDTKIASIQTQVDEAISLRRSVDGVARAAEFFHEGGCCESRLAMLAAVTRSLPDDAYLTAMTLRGNRLTMSGLSPAAAQLVGSFARLADFKDPSFDSPVVGNRDGELERFTISVQLAKAGAP